MAAPLYEFRAYDITGTEPSNRTSEGDEVDTSSVLALGTANVTSGKKQLGPFCVCFRITNMSGYAAVNGMKFGITANGALNNNAKFYLDITSTWTQNKTKSQVTSGTPGKIANGIPSVANLTKIDSGNIAGINHANTSQYIYMVVEVASDEKVGTDKGDTDGTLAFTNQFDYS